MKKYVSILVLSVFLLGLFLVPNQQVLAANSLTDLELEQMQKPSFNIKVFTPDKKEAKKIHYKLDNLYTLDTIASGISDNGKIKINVDPTAEEKEYLNTIPTKDLNVQYIKYALRVFDFDGHMKNYYFEVPVIKDKDKLSTYKINRLKDSKLKEDITIELVPGKKRAVEKSAKEINSSKVQLMSKDVSIMGANILESYDYTSPTIVGYVSSMPGFKNTFKFTTGADVKIDAMVNYGTGWEVSGGYSESSSTTTTHESISPSSARTTEAKDNFRYRWNRVFDDLTGMEYEEIYSLYHIGSYGWGSYASPGNNSKPASDVQAGSYGANWMRITPTNYTDKSSTNGTRFSGAATVKGVSLGLSTQYYGEAKYEFRSHDGGTYYIYDYDSTGKKWYVTK